MVPAPCGSIRLAAACATRKPPKDEISRALLLSYTREKKGTRRFPIIKRVTPRDVEWFMQDLAEDAEKRPR